MNDLRFQSFFHFFPPTDPEGRKCAEVQETATPAESYRTTTMGPTRALLPNHSPPSGSVRPPIVDNPYFTNPVPVVPAVDEFPIAPPDGPSTWGETFATSRLTCRSLSFRVSHVNCERDVAFISFPADSPSCTSHASILPHRKPGGLVHRGPHRSSHRTHRVRFSRGPIC